MFIVIVLLPLLDDYNDLEKPDLISLVVSYNQKVKALSSELLALKQSKKESPPSKGPEKDKYKQLARRLKEERNQYREAIEEKL